MDEERFDELANAAALPFVLGMALGIAIGRFSGNLLFGVVLGIVLFVLFAWIKLRLTELPS